MSQKKPFFRSATGIDTKLVWTRLLPEAEVGQSAPVAAPPMAQAFGFQEVTEDGVMFRVAMDGGSAIVTVQPEVMVTGEGFDQVRRARVPNGVLGPRSPVDLDRPWRSNEALAARQTALDLLAAHNHPLDYLHRPIGWAWLDSDLCWAEMPEQGGGLVGLTRSGKSLAVKKTKGPPDLVPISYAASLAKKDPRYEVAWPAFGAVAWARRIYEATETMAWVQDALKSAAADQAGLTGAIWQQAFLLGAHLTEHRLRGLHDGMLITGQRNRAGTSAGGTTTTKKARIAREKQKEAALGFAADRLAEPHMKPGKSWSVDALATEVYAGWKPDAPPSRSTIIRFLREAVKDDDARVSALNKSNASG